MSAAIAPERWISKGKVVVVEDTVIVGGRKRPFGMKKVVDGKEVLNIKNGQRSLLVGWTREDTFVV